MCDQKQQHVCHLYLSDLLLKAIKKNNLFVSIKENDIYIDRRLELMVAKPLMSYAEFIYALSKSPVCQKYFSRLLYQFM